MNQPTLVQLDTISFHYDGESVLEDITMAMKRGEFVGVIGPNGSGKTTLLKILLGLLQPSSGSVFLFGEKISQFKDWQKIGYVPQRPGASVTSFPITVEEVVGLGRVNTKHLFDIPSSKDREEVTHALDAVGMEHYRRRLIHELSGGQQQKVFIAKALVTHPELLILDEPTVGVDVDAQAKFYELLRDLKKKFQLTLVLVSHDVDVVAHEVDIVACLNKRLICHGPPNDIMKGDFIGKLYNKDLRFVVHGH